MSYTKLILKNNIRIYASDLTAVAQEYINLKKPTPLVSLSISTAIAAFGPFSIIKSHGNSSLLIKSDGLLKTIIVENDSEGNIRALASNEQIHTELDQQNFNHIPIKLGIGSNGTLKIINYYDGESFGGEVNLAKGDITTDIAYYFAQSEQIFTAVVTDVSLKTPTELERAYSIIFQLLPSHTEDDVVFIEEFIKNHKLSKFSLEEYVAKIKGHELISKDLRWQCVCNQEKIENIAKLLSNDEKRKIIEEHGSLEITCSFCGKNYYSKL